MLEVDHFLTHFVSLFLFILDVSLEALIGLGGSLGLLHATLHVLHQLGQLSILLIFLLEDNRDLSVFLLHLIDYSISLLEFLFNNLELLRISEGIFRADNLFKLVSQPGALFHVNLDFDLDLLQS